LFFAALGVLSSCGSSGPTAPRPEPVLSSDSIAQVRFRDLSEKWHAASAEQRLQLEAPLRQYLEEFPYDAPRRRVWVYLAWILVHKGELLEAKEWIDRAKAGPPGSVSDLAVVTEAALLLELNQPQEALRKLRPIRGKLIDPVERFLATEQLVLAAMAAELYSEALIYMVDWATQAPVTEREQVRESIISHLHRIPRRYLERALQHDAESITASGDDDPIRRDQQQWMKDAIARRLTAIAVEERDPDLARFVLEQGSDLGAEREAAQDLMDLATSTESGRQVKGRTIGLVLTTATEEQRLRSSEVATAVAITLGLPRRDRDPNAVRVVFAQDEGGPAGATAAFQNLGIQGAAVVIGGFDSDSAQQHSWQAERSAIPTLLLYPHQIETPSWSYTLGVSGARERALLEDEMRSRGLFASRLVENDEVACDPNTTRAVQAKVRGWAEGGSDSVLFLGTRGCAQLVLQANARAKRPLPIGLGLDAAAAATRSDPLAIALAPGAYPFEPNDPKLGAWLERNGTTPSWFEALGHDAAVLASAALSQFPAVDYSGSNEVNVHHNAIRAALLRLSDVALWTSQSSRFDPELVIDRRFDFTGAEADAP
jgi:tetratricopeptide (TPR) repeat protein